LSDYDFHELSSHDFEVLVRDLLQAEWGIRIESFKTGKDRGVAAAEIDHLVDDIEHEKFIIHPQN
jgi:hypothetical protein